MDQGENLNPEQGEATKDTVLQKGPIGSINSEDLSTFNSTEMSTIGAHDQPHIVDTESPQIIQQLNASETFEAKEETVNKGQVESNETTKASEVMQLENTATTSDADTVYESTTTGASEGKIEDLGDVVLEPLKLSQITTAEEQLEYDEEEEEEQKEDEYGLDKTLQGEAVNNTVRNQLESGSNLTSTKNAEGVNEIDFKIHETVDNVSDAKSDKANNQGTKGGTNTENDSTSLTTIEHNGEDAQKSKAVDTEAVATNDGSDTQSGINDQDNKNQAITSELVEGIEKIEVVTANGEKEEIDLDARGPNPEEDNQYTALKSNPKEHFDEGMDDINTLVEDLPNFKGGMDNKIPIYLTHKNAMFLLFRTDSQDGPSAIFEDEKSEDITLDEFFAILRTISEFHFELDEEIILSIPQFGGIALTEDNVYCKDLQLSDFLDVYYKLCDCTTAKEKVPKQLDFKLSTQPRFIMKYNSLVDTIKQNGGFDNISHVDYIDNETDGSRKKRKL